MKNTIAILFVLSLHVSSKAQRLSTGFLFGTPAFHQTKFESNYLFPEHSYFTYITGNEEGDPVHNQRFNGLSAGVSVNVDYKRWMISTEFVFSNGKIKIPILYPATVSGDNQWSTFEILKSGFHLPVYLSYKLTSKANGPYAIGGIQYSALSFSENPIHIDQDISAALLFQLTDTEMYNIIYNEYNYFSAIAGLGYKRNNSYYSVRFIKRVGGDLSKYPIGRFLQVDFVYSKLLNFQKLKKGYHLYLD